MSTAHPQSTTTPGFTIRPATEADVGLVLAFVKALADYERLSHEVVATEADLRRHLFGPHPHAEVLLGEADGTAVGFALFFHNFSTFLGKPGLYLEDIFVLPAHRGHGYGKAMLAELARLAVERDCGRMEWSVLDWNEPSIAFYKALGARPLDDWTVYRLTGDALRAVARQVDRD